MLRLELRDPDGATNRPDVVVERFHAANGVAPFAGLAEASEYLDHWFPGNEIRFEPDATYVLVDGVEVARLVDVNA